MLRHRLHGIAALAHELARRGFFRVLEAILQAVAVGVAPLAHRRPLRQRQGYFFVMMRENVVGAIEHNRILLLSVRLRLLGQLSVSRADQFALGRC